MLARIALYSTLGLVLDALGCRWDTAGFWCVVALFWASETLSRTQLIDQLNDELEEMRRINGLIDKKKESNND